MKTSDAIIALQLTALNNKFDLVIKQLESLKAKRIQTTNERKAEAEMETEK